MHDGATDGGSRDEHEGLAGAEGPHGPGSGAGHEGAARNVFSGAAGTAVQIGRDFTGSLIINGDAHGHFTGDFTGDTAQGSRPHQVPVVIGPFVGREALLAEIEERWQEAAGTGTVLVVVFRGQPGVGKRAAVRRWAHRDEERFPLGRLHVDFDRLRPHPGGLSADLPAALGQCLRGLGAAAGSLPPLSEASLDGLRERYRRMTGTGRVLLSLDNVTASAQVSLLLPNSAGSVVLVTSPKQLTTLDASAGPDVLVHPLRPPQDLELLEKICGRARVAGEPEAARRAAEYCAGLPVALRIAGALLKSRPEMSVAELADQLADERVRLKSLQLEGATGEESSVNAVFGVAYEGLPAEEARAYRLLAFFPGQQWDTGTAAAILGVGERDATTALRSLVTAGLVARAGMGQDVRYGFPELVGLHAREEAKAAAHDVEATERLVVERAVDHLLRRAAQADLAAMGDRLRRGSYVRWLAVQPDPAGGFGSRDEALEWLDTERAELLDVLRAAAAYELHRPVAELAEVMTALYLHLRYTADWRESGALGVRAAEQLTDDPGLEARLRCLLARPLADLGEDDLELDELTRAVARADACGDPLLRASAREFYGRYWERHDPHRAVAAHSEALTLYEEAGDPRGTAVGTFFLGRAQDLAGRHAEALQTLREAHKRFEAPEVADERMGARALAALGTVQRHVGEAAEAQESLEVAAGRLRAARSVHYEAEACEALAELAAERGDTAERQARLERALDVYEEAGNPRAETVRALLEGH